MEFTQAQGLSWDTNITAAKSTVRCSVVTPVVLRWIRAEAW